MRSFYGLVAGVSLHSLLVASTGPVVDVGYARYEGVTDASLGYDIFILYLYSLVGLLMHVY